MSKITKLILAIAALSSVASCGSIKGPRDTTNSVSLAQETDRWFLAGHQALAARQKFRTGPGRAKNIILFVADGMDPTTVTAARIFDGQSRGEAGEENFLSFETFPHIAVSKTYTTDFQVPDSAGTMTAMVTGVKTRSGVLSVSEAVERGNCKSGLSNSVTTIAEIAEQKGLSTGIISTARLTHATPAAVYAHVSNRGWENDRNLPDGAHDEGCTDIAAQLIEFDFGDGIDLALGGGRTNFLPDSVADPEYPERNGLRTDGRDLLEEWQAKSSDHVTVWNAEQLAAISDEANVLGLFEPSHMQYNYDRDDDSAGEPSLAEMTEFAIERLEKNDQGFFLMVEAGRVDHAHHAGNALRALSDTQAFSKAIATARTLTDKKDTLIIVTADHGHTMSFSGYPLKGNNILGLVNRPGFAKEKNELLANASDGKPYTTLSYANGPGARLNSEDDDLSRKALSPEIVTSEDYRQDATIPLRSETHGGQDVLIYADGPGAELIGGVVEQNYIFHVMAEMFGFFGDESN